MLRQDFASFHERTEEISVDSLKKRAEAFLAKTSGGSDDYKLPGEVDKSELAELKKEFDHVIGTTTFSGQLVDDDAKPLVKEVLKKLLLDKLNNGESVLLVSGSTNLGGVKDTYDVLDDKELQVFREAGLLKSMGLVAGVGVLSAYNEKQKNPDGWGIRNTDHYYFDEEHDGWRGDLGGDGPGGWGSESPTFQDFITELIAFGGGPQAASEIEGVAEMGKLVTVLLGVKNGAKQDGEAELKVRVAKLGAKDGGKRYAAQVKAGLEAAIAKGGDEEALKLLNKQLQAALKALAFKLSGSAKRKINIVDLT